MHTSSHLSLVLTISLPWRKWWKQPSQPILTPSPFQLRDNQPRTAKTSQGEVSGWCHHPSFLCERAIWRVSSHGSKGNPCERNTDAVTYRCASLHRLIVAPAICHRQHQHQVSPLLLNSGNRQQQWRKLPSAILMMTALVCLVWQVRVCICRLSTHLTTFVRILTLSRHLTGM